MKRFRSGSVLWSAVLLLLAACAAGQRDRPSTMPQPNSIFVAVQNNLVPPTALTVYLVSAEGRRNVLGSVSPGSSRTFEFEPPRSSEEYVLQAETAEGRDLQSNRFTLAPGDEVSWSVRTNIVEVSR